MDGDSDKQGDPKALIDETANIVEVIRARADKLSRAEHKVAAAVLDDPAAAMKSSTAVLAGKAGVSDPTVNRFCLSLGCAGFPELKLRLAQSLARGVPFVNRHVAADDTPETYTGKIFDATTAALSRAQERIDMTEVGRAVDALAAAARISFFGIGGSGAVAVDAQHKFVRLDVPSVAQSDIVMQRMQAAGMDEGDVVVLISNTGCTIPMIENARLAASRGAKLVALTAAGSPLAQVCDIVIGIDPAEDADIYIPMASRIVHLVILDVLSTGVILGRGAGFQDRLARIKESLRPGRTTMISGHSSAD
ncbi:transcriptional regulator HexR [Pelagibius sp. Alg239-R121]|uniref:transcriptional regulator HexR n=1 Tax=Pelagibius sp. Alg239-R121 TaxID=2993448 RepID=UPI0024A61B6A|nr:transcriptional regulator HexR [Pelagibius sp. Alg239-R121]